MYCMGMGDMDGEDAKAESAIRSSEAAVRVSSSHLHQLTGASGLASSGCGLFSGLVICVTGLSKEARKHVMEVTERLGGAYSPSLHPGCTHLLVQTSGGRKLEHALKHGLRNGLHVVTLGWFVDSMRKNTRLSELLYTVCSVGKVGTRTVFSSTIGADDSCVQRGGIEPQKSRYSRGKCEVNAQSNLSDRAIYIDLDVSAELRNKVVDAATREGSTLVDKWFVGCGANYVVCEGSSIQKYLGHCDNIVSPVWVLKTSKERSTQRFVGLSADLARQVGLMLENWQHVMVTGATCKDYHEHSLNCGSSKVSQEERLQLVKLAKCGIRNRRARRLQKCEIPLRPISPSKLLESICWSISEPTSRAAVYADSLMSKNDPEILKDGMCDGQEPVESDISFSNVLRPLVESEKNELIFHNHFLTILFPVDRYAEMGPSSRTYFSETGFRCLQLLDFIYDFYQESMSDHEIQAAIYTDSRHAEELRSEYSCERSKDSGIMMYKRINFLGSRKSFEMLKRINGDNNSNVYELLLRA